MAQSVIIYLTLTDSSFESHPQRTITLYGFPHHTCKIGRGSRSGGPELHPSFSNALFDSRVMSREHACVRADFPTKRIWIEDVGSMHGTKVNGVALKPNVCTLLFDDDKLVFGAEVSRGPDFFPPLEASVSFEWLNHPLLSPRNTFTADFSDDDFDEDEEEAQIITEMARSSSIEVVIPPVPVRVQSIPDSDVEITSPDSWAESDDDLQSEVSSELNTSIPSPTGLTDAEKREDLDKLAAAKGTSFHIQETDANATNGPNRPIHLDVYDYITESEFEMDEDGFQDKLDEDEKYDGLEDSGREPTNEAQYGRTPSPSDAAMPKPQVSNYGPPPAEAATAEKQVQDVSLNSIFTDLDGNINRRLPSLSSVVPPNSHFMHPAAHYPTTPYKHQSSVYSTYDLPYSAQYNSNSGADWPAYSVGSAWQTHSTDNVDNGASPQPSYEAKAVKRKADLISTGDHSFAPPEECSKRSSEPEVQEIPAYDFYQSTTSQPSSQAYSKSSPPPASASPRKAKKTASDKTPAACVFEGNRTTGEPPKKRARAEARETRHRPSFGRYMATAVAGMAIGAIGAVWGLVALPDNFFS